MQTCPDTAYRTSRLFCHEETIEKLLIPAPDCVVDAIDSLNPKAVLLEFCVRRAIPVISSMGASSRRDPTRLRVGDISRTTICPLAKKLRARLKHRGVDHGITCVYSVESPAPPLPPDPGDLTYERGRVRNRLPSHIGLPGMFGYALASLVLDRLAGAEGGAGA
jgi:tRNA A37 threonylcarbamoyladenosine dehydratase